MRQYQMVHLTLELELVDPNLLIKYIKFKFDVSPFISRVGGR